MLGSVAQGFVTLRKLFGCCSGSLYNWDTHTCCRMNSQKWEQVSVHEAMAAGWLRQWLWLEHTATEDIFVSFEFCCFSVLPGIPHQVSVLSFVSLLFPSKAAGRNSALEIPLENLLNQSSTKSLLLYLNIFMTITETIV